MNKEEILTSLTEALKGKDGAHFEPVLLKSFKYLAKAYGGGESGAIEIFWKQPAHIGERAPQEPEIAAEIGGQSIDKKDLLDALLPNVAQYAGALGLGSEDVESVKKEFEVYCLEQTGGRPITYYWSKKGQYFATLGDEGIKFVPITSLINLGGLIEILTKQA